MNRSQRISRLAHNLTVADCGPHTPPDIRFPAEQPQEDVPAEPVESDET